MRKMLGWTTLALREIPEEVPVDPKFKEALDDPTPDALPVLLILLRSERYTVYSHAYVAFLRLPPEVRLAALPELKSLAASHPGMRITLQEEIRRLESPE
jgi:hypothetical protein